MLDKTANLQPRTVRQAAAFMGVSERMVYMASELIATGRKDLCNEVDAGRMRLHAALKIAKPEKYTKKRPDQYLALVKAFEAAPDDVRCKFAAYVRRASP